jgi:hypothetical protein
MASKINTTTLVFLTLSIGLVSCKYEIKLKKTGKIAFVPVHTVDEKLPTKGNDKNIFDYIYQNENSIELLDQSENNCKVHGIDEDGNLFFGHVNIEGKAGIGIISGIEARGIEIVAERTSPTSLTAMDVTGYEYKLEMDDN